MTANEPQRLPHSKAAREMLAADAYADVLVNTFRGTAHEREAARLAQRVADSAVEASRFQRGADRDDRAAEQAEAARATAKAERRRAEEAVQRWFTEDRRVHGG
ncbi:hypothetical protein [Saccharothrix syringae]|uniref:Uncharacterized protein n=1 Tax=Saccharothrix syringae TaxID=103733 RepID=A0A5Q0H3M8_SACSY|nr:hypothetical protein [Saccharothrix syringae]QFZ20410.1 hypothetical protein EKG83_26000 [Saccharothrix syringae]